MFTEHAQTPDTYTYPYLCGDHMHTNARHNQTHLPVRSTAHIHTLSTHLHVLLPAHTHTDTHLHTYTDAHLHLLSHAAHTLIHTHTCAHLHTHAVMHTTYTCAHLHTHTSMHTYTCAHLHTHTDTHLHVLICKQMQTRIPLRSTAHTNIHAHVPASVLARRTHTAARLIGSMHTGHITCGGQCPVTARHGCRY